MTISNNIQLIGIDLGGTKVNAGLIRGNNVIETVSKQVPHDSKNEWDLIHIIINLIKELIAKYDKVDGIGIGVPSILDREQGIIHEVQNIPSWQEVPLAKILNSEFNIPVYLDNDANCFALGEYHFGAASKCKNVVGITIGTGLGAGIITNGHLMSDANGGAGEFGMIPYQEGILEDYCSGKFFKIFYKATGEELMVLAEQGDLKAIKAFEEFGKHIGNAIKIIMYSVDPKTIIIGGSVANSSKYFKESLSKSVGEFPYRKSLENFKIEFSNTPNIALLGAISLFYDRNGQSLKK